MKTFVCKVVLLAVTASVLLSATFAFAGADSFNRKRLGAAWVVTAGGLGVSNHQLIGTQNNSLGYYTAANTNTAATVVVKLGGTDLEYGAIALGNVAGGNNAFVKIQEENADGMFEYGAFYTGNNSGSIFFQLSSPVPSPAILDVFFCGTVATMRITSAAGVQTYTNDYGTTYGAGVGLGTYGSVGLDNLIGFPSACNDASANAIPASMMPRAVDLSLVK